MNIPEEKKQFEQRQSRKHEARSKEWRCWEVGKNWEFQMKRQYSHQRGDLECQAEELGNGEPSKAFEEGRDAIGEHERKDRGPLMVLTNPRLGFTYCTVVTF